MEMEKYLHHDNIVRGTDILLNREQEEGQRKNSQQQHIPDTQQSAIVEEVCSTTGSSVARIEGGVVPPPTTTSPPATASNHHVKKYYPTTPTTTAMGRPCSWARSNRVDDVISTSSSSSRGVEVILDAPVLTITTPPAPAPSYSFSSNLKMEQSCSMLLPAPMVVTPFHHTTTPTDATNNHVFNHHTVAQNGLEGNPPLEYVFIPSLESTTNNSSTTDSLPSQQDIMNSTVPSSCILPKFSPPYKKTTFSSCMDFLSWPHLPIQQQQVEEEGDHDMNSVPLYQDEQEEHFERMTLEEDPIMTTIDTTWKASNWAMRTSYAFDFDHSSHHGAESLIFSSSEASLEEEDNDEDDYLDGIKYVSSGAYIYY